VFDVLLHLVRNRDRIVGKDDLLDTGWDGRIVSESTLSSRISAVRHALGDSGTEQKFIRTVPRRGFRFVGELRSPDGIATGASASSSTDSGSARRSRPIAQEIRFHATADGVSLSYPSLGAGPVLVKAANWMNHLEFEVENPPWDYWWRALSERDSLVRYDQCGNGLSDWDVDDISFDAFVSDLEALVDAMGLERFALLGISQGCGISVAYAVKHPERVSHLILYGGYTKGWRERGGPDEVAQGQALTTLIEQGWGQDNPAFRQLFTSMFLPGGSQDQMTAFNDLERLTVSARNAARFHEVFGRIDVSGLLSRVRTKTLVVHCRDDARAPFDEGRAFAAGIPDARFVPLAGRNHIILPQEPAWPRFVEEVSAFLTKG
jgi:pimeloyl-ACP methyl ester carboxylesterase/DNA-binding winged helix-turn-helix (wHTH) protein